MADRLQKVAANEEEYVDVSAEVSPPEEDGEEIIRRKNLEDSTKVTQDTHYELFQLGTATGKFIKNIAEHESYHGEMNGEKSAKLFNLAPENIRGYITRYSDSQDCYVISSLMQQSPGRLKLRHILLEVDEERQIFAIKGVPKVFRSAGSLLKFYEDNSISPSVGIIGIPLSPEITKIWWTDNSSKNGARREESAPSQAPTVPEDQQQLTQVIKEAIMEPLTEQKRAYEDQITQLQKSNQLLMEELLRQRQQQDQLRREHTTRCSIQ